MVTKDNNESVNMKKPIDGQISDVFLPFYWYLKIFGLWPSKYQVLIKINLKEKRRC